MPESGGVDTGGEDGGCLTVTCVAQAMSRGTCWAPRVCIRADSHCGVCLKSAVTKLVYFELFSK